MRRFIIMLALMVLPAIASAQSHQPLRVFIGANGVWFTDESRPADLELGGTASLSLSPHISGVAGGFYGIEHSYLRGQFGPRVTVTDVDNRDFSVGLGVMYQVSSKEDIRPQEWGGEVVLGYRPWPETMHRMIVGASGFYGFDSSEAFYTIAARYEIGGAR